MNGWREAHAHVGQYGAALAMVDLTTAADVAEVQHLLARDAAGRGQDEWVIGHGLRVEALAEGHWPSIDDIDRAVGGRPCVVRSFDHHAVVAGAAALELSGLRQSEPDGGMVERDRQGELTGVAYESAARAIWGTIPSPTDSQLQAQALIGIRTLADMGCREVHDLLTDLRLLEAFVRLDREGHLDALDVTIKAFVPAHELFAHLDAARTAVGQSTGRLELAGAKVFVDGTLNGRTAWMLHPYEQAHPDHPCGMALMTREDLAETIRACDELGLPLASHAIGDAAVRAVLDAIDAVSPRTPGSRIEHAEIVDEADVPRFAVLGVICSPQPCHLLVDIEALNRYLPHRLERVLPLRDLIDAGCDPGEGLMFGSDVPIVRADPNDSLLAATTRGRAGSPGAIAPAQAITESEARACFAPLDS